MEDLYYGTDYQSHLGTEFGGLAIQGDKLHSAIHRIARGQFKNLFYDFYNSFGGNMGLGVISDSNPQPIAVAARFGTCSLVTSGLVSNREELAQNLIEQGVTFSEIEDGQINTTELAAKIIAQAEDIVEGLQRLFDLIEGSLSLLLMTEEGIYAACDQAGRVPLAIAQRDGTVAAGSETCAFPNLGLEIQKHIQPGEIVYFDADGMQPRCDPPGGGKICAFLWIYTGYPASTYRGVSVESVREHCGQALAKKDNIQPDLVSGVPDSGTGHAIGYAIESGKPFRRPLVKYTAGYGRSYIPPSQKVRDRIARMKLIAIEDIIRDNKLVVCEDSIVRGTQLKNLTITKLHEAQADEIHIRVACPPLMFPCRYSISTRSKGELAARKAIRELEGREVGDVSQYLDPTTKGYKQMVDWIRRDIGATSLTYLTMEEVVDAIGLPKSNLCTYCWNGSVDKD